MVDETVVAHTVYQGVLQLCVYQVENSVHINYLYFRETVNTDNNVIVPNYFIENSVTVLCKRHIY